VVDGRPRPCSRKAFELIRALCRQPRRALPRDALIAEVWCGGQIVSDEALTQLVYRARNVIEPDGDLIVTIRGVGFALDVDVRIGNGHPFFPRIGNGHPFFPNPLEMDTHFSLTHWKWTPIFP
jgi:DNA-binding winged helix-turn-helix (wHTH) protein